MNGMQTGTFPGTFDKVLDLTKQLSLPEKVKLLSQLAVDIEYSLTLPEKLFPKREFISSALTPEMKPMRLRAIEELYGSMANILSHSDDFARRKQEEIDWEDRHFKRHF